MKGMYYISSFLLITNGFKSFAFVDDVYFFSFSHTVSIRFKVARYSFSGSIPPTFERKLRRHKQRFGKIETTVVLDTDETLL